MDRQTACCVVSWEAMGSNSAVGMKFWEVRRKINSPFFLKFLHFYHIIKYLQKFSSGCLKNRAEGLKWSMLLYLSPL